MDRIRLKDLPDEESGSLTRHGSPEEEDTYKGTGESGLLFITGSSLSGFRSPEGMMSVRKRAMDAFLGEQRGKRSKNSWTASQSVPAKNSMKYGDAAMAHVGNSRTTSSMTESNAYSNPCFTPANSPSHTPAGSPSHTPAETLRLEPVLSKSGKET
jgi:hypothetical protein